MWLTYQHCSTSVPYYSVGLRVFIDHYILWRFTTVKVSFCAYIHSTCIAHFIVRAEQLISPDKITIIIICCEGGGGLNVVEATPDTRQRCYCSLQSTTCCALYDDDNMIAGTLVRTPPYDATDQSFAGLRSI